MPQTCHFGYRDLSQGLVSFKHPGTSFRAGCVLVKSWTSLMCAVIFADTVKGVSPGRVICWNKSKLLFCTSSTMARLQKESVLGSFQCNPDTPSNTINHQLQDTLATVLTVTSRIATLNQKFCWQTESVWKQDSNRHMPSTEILCNFQNISNNRNIHTKQSTKY